MELLSIFVQEMLEQGILAHKQFYTTFAHKSKHVVQYAKACDKSFRVIKKYLTGELKNYKINMIEELKK